MSLLINKFHPHPTHGQVHPDQGPELAQELPAELGDMHVPIAKVIPSVFAGRPVIRIVERINAASRIPAMRAACCSGTAIARSWSGCRRAEPTRTLYLFA